MQGRELKNHQESFGFCVEDRVPVDHPLREVKIFVERILHKMRHELSEMYSYKGRPSIPPQRLLKSLVLMALFTIRSERQFCGMVEYNMLFRWFLNMGALERVFDSSVFSKNRERLMKHEIGRKFFNEVVEELKRGELLGSEHFSVDGTLIQAWASLKSLKERDKDDYDQRTGGKSEKKIGTNDKYVSSTDSEAVVAKKPGVSARLCYTGNVLMENRYGLCVDVEIIPATGTSERQAAEAMIQRQLENDVSIATLGADANYHSTEFIRTCRENEIIPHVAPQGNRKIPGIDGRTFKSKGYAISQAARKGIEKLFGWVKNIGGWKRSRFRGTKRVSLFALFGMAAINILRSLKLNPALGR